MLETAEFKEMKEYIEEQGFNENIIEDVVNTCERLGKYVANWDILTDTFIVVYNDYSVGAYDLY